MWLLSGPFYSQEVYTEESAIRLLMTGEFENDRTLTANFKKFRDEVEKIDTNKDPKGHFNYLKEELGKRAEVYT